MSDLPKTGFVVSQTFDERFYRKIYGSLLEGRPAKEHYESGGFELALYPSRAAVERDVALIEASGKFDAEYYQEQVGDRDDPLFDYLLNSYRSDIKPNREFDLDFFKRYYRRSIPGGMSPFLFYCLHSHRPWCFPRRDSVDALARILSTSELFDADWFQKTYLAADPAADSVVYYCTEGFRLMMNPSEKFSTRGYLIQYPDIARSQMNPLFHYVAHGRKEGRSKFSKNDVVVKKGRSAPRVGAKTILMVCHEASRSGAPIVGLNIIKALGKEYDVVTLLLKGGALEDQFVANSEAVYLCDPRVGQIEACLQAISDRYKIDCAILNSIVTSPVIEGVVGRDIPCVTLIHEFSQYLRPGEQISRAVALSDQVVVPAEVVGEAIFEEMRAFGFTSRAKNINIMPQGQSFAAEWSSEQFTEEDIYRRLGVSADQRDKVRIVLGAGSVQPRKGVDLFIETARRVRERGDAENIKFIWVGGNFRPESDYHYSVYLSDQIRRNGLDDCLVMVDEQSTLAPFWKVSDLFFMSSRLDPYPNVALDALRSDLRVVCFDRATGIAELSRELPLSVRVAPYCDTTAAADIIIEILAEQKASSGADAARSESARITELLDFSRYVRGLEGIMAKARANSAEAAAMSERLLSRGLIDPTWMRASLPSWLVTEDVGLANNVVGLGRLAARLATNGVPAASPSRGRAFRRADGPAAVGDDLAPYASEPYPDERPRSHPVAVVALVTSESDVRRLMAIASSGTDIDDLHVLVDVERLKVHGGSLESLAGSVRLHSIDHGADLEAIVTSLLGSLKSRYAVLLRPSRGGFGANESSTEVEAALAFASSEGGADEGYDLVFARAVKAVLERRGIWRAGRRLGLGAKESAGGFPLGARIDEDVLAIAPGSVTPEIAAIAARFFHGALYPSFETQWIDMAVRFTVDSGRWAILEPRIESGEGWAYDAIFGYQAEPVPAA